MVWLSCIVSDHQKVGLWCFRRAFQWGREFPTRGTSPLSISSRAPPCGNVVGILTELLRQKEKPQAEPQTLAATPGQPPVQIRTNTYRLPLSQIPKHSLCTGHERHLQQGKAPRGRAPHAGRWVTSGVRHRWCNVGGAPPGAWLRLLREQRQWWERPIRYRHDAPANHQSEHRRRESPAGFHWSKTAYVWFRPRKVTRAMLAGANFSNLLQSWAAYLIINLYLNPTCLLYCYFWFSYYKVWDSWEHCNGKKNCAEQEKIHCIFVLTKKSRLKTNIPFLCAYRFRSVIHFAVNMA